jgi:hypothetical protein
MTQSNTIFVIRLHSALAASKAWPCLLCGDVEFFADDSAIGRSEFRQIP